MTDCILLVVQFFVGLICLRALWISRRRSKSKLTVYLIIHTACLAAVNIVGLVTSVISLDIVVTLPRIASGLKFCDEYWRGFQKLRVLNAASNVAFAISGSLTDAMLVSNELFDLMLYQTRRH